MPVLPVSICDIITKNKGFVKKKPPIINRRYLITGVLRDVLLDYEFAGIVHDVEVEKLRIQVTLIHASLIIF